MKLVQYRCLPKPPEHCHSHSSHEKSNHCKEQSSKGPGLSQVTALSTYGDDDDDGDGDQQTKDWSSRGGTVELLGTRWASSCFSLHPHHTDSQDEDDDDDDDGDDDDGNDDDNDDGDGEDEDLTC